MTVRLLMPVLFVVALLLGAAKAHAQTPEPKPETARVPQGAREAEAPRPVVPFADAPARREAGRAYSETRYPVGRAVYLPMLKAHAERVNVPPDLLEAMAAVASGFDPHAVGDADEVGLLQVRPALARILEFDGGVQALFEPETNVRLGANGFGEAWKRAEGQICLAIAKYRSGWDETRLSPLTVEACRRVRQHLTLIGSPLANDIRLPNATRPFRSAPPEPEASVPGALPAGVATAAVAGAAAAGVRAAQAPARNLRNLPRAQRIAILQRQAQARQRRVSGRFSWAAHTARIRAIEAGLRGNTPRIMRNN